MHSVFLLMAFWLVALFNTINGLRKDKCEAPPSETGPCKVFLTRWIYKSNECQELNYGGCDGTANLFFTQEECRAACQNNSL